jgi:hypothetical protein
MTSWHVGEGVLAAYVDRGLDGVQRASVEAHLTRCASCRGALAHTGGGASGTVSFDRLWDRIETRVEDLPAGRSPEWLQRIGVREPDTVVVRAVGSQSAQWTLATTLVLAAAALAAALGGNDSARLAFLVLAPLLPPLGVAATFRLTSSSTAMLETTAPYSPARLLLWRTAYVVATAVPAAVAFGAVIPGNAWMAVAWLLPSAACTLIVLVAATWTDPLMPALAVSTVWLALVVGWQLRDMPTAISAPAVQLSSAVITIAAALVLQRRLMELRVPTTWNLDEFGRNDS